MFIYLSINIIIVLLRRFIRHEEYSLDQFSEQEDCITYSGFDNFEDLHTTSTFTATGVTTQDICPDNILPTAITDNHDHLQNVICS